MHMHIPIKLHLLNMSASLSKTKYYFVSYLPLQFVKFYRRGLSFSEPFFDFNCKFLNSHFYFARFFDSNMVEIPVEVETPDQHYYHLAFFTTRKVKAMEELTWVSRIYFIGLSFMYKCAFCSSRELQMSIVR
ncbi:uncharacterized protein LOC111402614 [Olea europaea var. sylvestris]|uniref:uncharacterized protein LOC111402614 n=1 Tax=Olea europaea var. sylvestris TaxID=158386 RepID=UPI000C1D0640|nr:uncharacterized protein LOC111402614 [Olea europaea var. sylvestris]